MCSGDKDSRNDDDDKDEHDSSDDDDVDNNDNDAKMVNGDDVIDPYDVIAI